MGDEVRTLGAPDPVLDPAMAAIVRAEIARAEERGRLEGERAGRAAAQAAAQRGAEAVASALAALRTEVSSQRDAACAASVDLAAELAREVVGGAPPEEATAILDRVRQAVAALDDDPLEVRLHPEDHRALADAIVEPRLALVPDSSLAPGDARVVGAWGGADLTRGALLEAAAQARREGRA
jgi:flagellar biosynthesis/type III secretory pathway protein FliH